MQLGTAYAFLMSQEYVYRYKPFLQRNMRTLEHGSYRYGKSFPAILAFV